MTLDIKMIKNFYENLNKKITDAKAKTKKPLTYAEKILFSHLSDLPENDLIRGESYVNLNPDRVAMQDATAQMAILQFMQAGKKEVAVPSSVHCDHLIPAKDGALKDLTNAMNVNKEVYEFLNSASKKYGIGFWGPNSGIIHQIVFENYAFPGGMMIGTDSHTPNAGGMSMAGIGIGGADAVDVMVGMPWELKWPKIIGVKLSGKLQKWASAKDVILKLLGILTVKGGTGAIIEYFGDGTKNLSATGKSTITNMGAELGATTSIFPFDKNIYDYLIATDREDVAKLAQANQDNLMADTEIYQTPEKYYDQIIEINLNELEPHLVGPFTPDLDRSISSMKAEVEEKNYPQELKVGLIGSCTNSSYEDLSKVASILNEAMELGLKPKAQLLISPGSEKIRQTIQRDGILKTLEDFGAVIFTNSCGPCIGQWIRQDFTEEKPNSIMTSFNRNFKARNDGNPETLAFIASPELIATSVISGRIDFNPETDFLENPAGQKVKLNIPTGKTLPDQPFEQTSGNFNAPDPSPESNVNIPKNSDRLQKLIPFAKWDGSDQYEDCLLLLKAKGKCTTDHISPAGKWLKYRGHLENISDNMYLGATNAFTQETGKGINLLTRQTAQTFSNIAKDYKNNQKSWIVIGDENYGEGSSREHAAMEPKYLGCKAIVAKSFARIAENNLKKQGLLVATFKDQKDYEKILETDIITINGLQNFNPGSLLNMTLKHTDGSTDTILLTHSFSEYQIKWFQAGSSLNYIRNNC